LPNAESRIAFVVATDIYVAIGTKYRKMIHLMTSLIPARLGFILVDPIRNRSSIAGSFDPGF
jgi:hypothetical protein